jgi:hypothetical protein
MNRGGFNLVGYHSRLRPHAHPWAWPFTTAITSHSASAQADAGEILDSLRLSLPTVAPGLTPGALRFVSLALHHPSTMRERHRRYVSARNVFESTCHSKTHCSTARASLRRIFSSQRPKTHTTASLDELAEPNYYSKCFETSSTHVFASQDSGTGTATVCAVVVSTATPRQSRDPSQRTLRISAAGSRFAHARKAPQLADSVSILYTTSFPIH